MNNAMAEEPPYLSVDTDVSAKYKGAFCEAKIRKVVRSVKCKVVFKQGWGSATIPDDQIRGTLRIGAVVEAKHPDRKEFAEATITKIQDCSQYTVVFDDGDITTLRRTALCLKSGRHFAESDTLDQLPLTHPEHFSNPVIGGRRGRRRLDENSEDEELLLMSGAELEDEREEHIGRVVCVEGSEKKKKKDNWFPGLVVAPTAQDNVPIHVKEEYLVRSFKDGRYYTVPKKEANEFTREVGTRAEHPSLKAAVEQALLYLDSDELPAHWDRDRLLYGLGDVGTDNDAAADYESSDDEPREEKDHFVAQLYKFMDDSGTPINKGPTIGTRDVDLYKLFKVVQNQGGYNRVTNHNNWKLVALKMGFGQNPITVNLVKIAYKKFLFTFEEFYRKLGCTLLNHPSRLSRSCCRGGRNLIRNKDQGNTLFTGFSKSDVKPRQVKELKTVQNEISVPITKIKVEKEDYVPSPPETEIDEEMPVEPSKSPSPTLSQRERPKRSLSSPLCTPVKVPLPLKIKLEPGISTTSTNTTSSINTQSSTINQTIESSPNHLSSAQNFIQTTQSVPPTMPQKKEQRSRCMKKFAMNCSTENLSVVSSANSVTSKDSDTSSNIDQTTVTQFKEKKRRAAFPRAVVAAKKVKMQQQQQQQQQQLQQQQQQQQQQRTTSPQPPGLAASRTKRTVNKDKLRNIVKNLKSKWASSSSLSSGNQEQSATKVTVKSKSKEDAGNLKSKKDDQHGSSGVANEDKKKGGRKRRDKRLSEDRFVPLPSYKTILPGDKLRVYYGPTLESKVTYEAKVLSIRTEGSDTLYLVHYTGWNNRYDEWIKTSRIADNLSWVPGRTARKTNQTPKAPKKKGGHKGESSVPVTKDVTPQTSNVSTTSSTSSSTSTVVTKSTVQNLMVSNTSRKASTRASTRAAASKKDLPVVEAPSGYESDTTETEQPVPDKKTETELSSKTNEVNEKKKKSRRKLDDENKEELNINYIKLDPKFYDDDAGAEGDDEEVDEPVKEIKDIKLDYMKTIKEEIELKENTSSSNQLGNVIIVDVQLKNESEEESLMIDESVSEIDQAQVIEGYPTSVINSDNNREDKFKVIAGQTGRDFDLTQIRSELKGIEPTVARTDEIEEEEEEEEDDEDDDEEEEEEGEEEIANTVDVYEFKEPEFETEKLDDSKNSTPKRSSISVRMFSDSGKGSTDEMEVKTSPPFSSNDGSSSDALTDERPIIKTCEEAFDRVCAEPLRAATERPPAGFLFMGEDEDEDVFDDDSQDRLIISERDSDNEIAAEVISVPSAVEQEADVNEEDDTEKTVPTVVVPAEDDSNKEILLSKEDDDEEEDLEDELLNVAIQRAIESSDDTSDGDLLSRHLAPRRMFTDHFIPDYDTENKTIQDTETENLKSEIIPVSNEEPSSEPLPKEDEVIKETIEVIPQTAIDLSQTNEDIQERVEVIAQEEEEEEIQCEDELITQEEPVVQETVINTLDIESNVCEDNDDNDEGDDIDDDDFIPVEEEAPQSPSIIITGRGPHTPPGPGPRTPPEPEPEDDEYNEAYEEDQYEEVGEEEVWSSGIEQKEISNIEESNQVDEDEPPPLLTREVEVEECDERQEDVEGNEDDNDETNLVSLLCEETIPGSPAVAVNTENYQLSPEGGEEEFNYTDVPVTKVEDETPSDKDNEKKELTIELDENEINGPANQTENSNQSIFKALPERSQTPVPSPASTLSSTNSPPREQSEPTVQEEIPTPKPATNSCENVQYISEPGPSSRPDVVDDTAKPTVNESSLRPRKSESRSSGKKRRRSRKRSEETSKRKCRSRHHGSDSDDNCDSSHPGFSRRSRTPPRLRKYNFSVHLSPELDHQQRVNRIQNAIGEVRKAHVNVKMELASIERRRKKLRRREREFRI